MNGRKEARKHGRSKGKKAARKEGRKEGRKAGRKEGRKEGRNEGRKEEEDGMHSKREPTHPRVVGKTNSKNLKKRLMEGRNFKVGFLKLPCGQN